MTPQTAQQPPLPAGQPHFYYKDGQLYAESVPLAHLAKTYGTPLYVYSRAALRDAWQGDRKSVV